MVPMLLLLLAVAATNEPMDESAAIATITRAITQASGATDSTRLEVVRGLHRELFGTEVSVNAAAVGALGEKRVVHPAWLVWGLGDDRLDCGDAQAEADYRQLGFVFSGEQENDGAVRMLGGQQEVVFQKTYGDLYTSYVVLFPAKDVARLKPGATIGFTFRVSALRIYPGSGIEVRGVATGMSRGTRKSR